MPTFDPHANFAFSTVATAPSPPTTGTSLTLAAGGGARFPAAPFNITISPANATRAQMAAGAEIARVTAVVGDVLTITRAAEGPNAARSVVIGDEVALSITIKDLTDIEAATTPTGSLMPYAADTAPAGWLLCDGTAVSRTTYAALYAILVTNKGTFTVTLATPAVFTTPAAHGLVVGDRVFFETTGALPTGLTADVGYIVTAVPTTTTFRVSASVSIIAGVSTPGGDVATSVSQSGVHTLFRAPYCLSGTTFAATTFNVPDLRGNTIYGKNAGVGIFDPIGEEAGEATHTLLTGEIPAHDHNSGTAGQTGSTTPATPSGSISGSTGAQSVDHSHAAGTLVVPAHTHPTVPNIPGDRGQATYTTTGTSKAINDLNNLMGGTGPTQGNPATDTQFSAPNAITGSTAGMSVGHTHDGSSLAFTGNSQGGHTHALASVGSATPVHQNLPPYIVMNYIIRT